MTWLQIVGHEGLGASGTKELEPNYYLHLQDQKFFPFFIISSSRCIYHLRLTSPAITKLRKRNTFIVRSLDRHVGL
jgi:hypothetical protein